MSKWKSRNSWRLEELCALVSPWFPSRSIQLCQKHRVIWVRQMNELWVFDASFIAELEILLHNIYAVRNLPVHFQSSKIFVVLLSTCTKKNFTCVLLIMFIIHLTLFLYSRLVSAGISTRDLVDETISLAKQDEFKTLWTEIMKMNSSHNGNRFCPVH